MFDGTTFLKNTVWLLLWTFLKSLDGFSSRRVSQKFFSEELLTSLKKHPRFVYIARLNYNCMKESVMVNKK